jgi:hypothetical protein
MIEFRSPGRLHDGIYFVVVQQPCLLIRLMDASSACCTCASSAGQLTKVDFGLLCNLHLISALESARRSSKQGAAACIDCWAHSAISASPPGGRRTHPCLCAEAGRRLLGSHPRCCPATSCSVSHFLLLCLVIPCFRHTGILNELCHRVHIVVQFLYRCILYGA